VRIVSERVRIVSERFVFVTERLVSSAEMVCVVGERTVSGSEVIFAAGKEIQEKRWTCPAIEETSFCPTELNWYFCEPEKIWKTQTTF